MSFPSSTHHFLQAQALSVLLNLSTAELLQNFPFLISSIHSQNLFTSPFASLPSSSPLPSFYSRLLTKALSFISQLPRPSSNQHKEQFLGLSLLTLIISSASTPTLLTHHSQWMKTLHSVQAGLPSSLRLMCVECQVELLGRVEGEALADAKRELVREYLTKVVSAALEGIKEEEERGGKATGRLRRGLRCMHRLLRDYGGSISGEQRAQIRQVLLRLLHPDSALTPLITSSLTLLHLALSSTSSHRASRQHQHNIQQAAQDTIEEVEENKRTLPPPSLSPYHHLALQAVHSLHHTLQPVLSSHDPPVSLPHLSTTDGFDWPDVSSSSFEVTVRYDRLTSLLLALLSPPPSPLQLTVPVPLLLPILFATLYIDPAQIKSSTATLIIPDLYCSALRLLHHLIQQYDILPYSAPLTHVLIDVYKKCDSLPSVLPLLYSVISSFLVLPLSPSLLDLLTRALLRPLLVHIKQPFIVRQALHTPTPTLPSQLKPTDRRKSPSTTEPHPLNQPHSDHVASSALTALHSLIPCLSLLPVSTRQSLRVREEVDRVLHGLGVVMFGLRSVSVELKCGVLKGIQRRVEEGGQGGVGGRGGVLVAYALPVFSVGMKDEDEEVRRMAREGMRMCEWIRAERMGVVMGKRRREELKEDEGVEDMMDGVEEWSAAVEKERVRMSSARVGDRQSDGGVMGGWGEEAKSAVGGKRRRMEVEEEEEVTATSVVEREDHVVAEVEGADDVKEADEEDKGEEEEDDEEGEEMEAQAEEESPRERSFNEVEVTSVAPAKAIVWVDDDEDVEEEDVPLNVDADPDDTVIQH